MKRVRTGKGKPCRTALWQKIAEEFQLGDIGKSSESGGSSKSVRRSSCISTVTQASEARNPYLFGYRYSLKNRFSRDGGPNTDATSKLGLTFYLALVFHVVLFVPNLVFALVLAGKRQIVHVKDNHTDAVCDAEIYEYEHALKQRRPDDGKNSDTEATSKILDEPRKRV